MVTDASLTGYRDFWILVDLDSESKVGKSMYLPLIGHGELWILADLDSASTVGKTM